MFSTEREDESSKGWLKLEAPIDKQFGSANSYFEVEVPRRSKGVHEISGTLSFSVDPVELCSHTNDRVLSFNLFKMHILSLPLHLKFFKMQKVPYSSLEWRRLSP